AAANVDCPAALVHAARTSAVRIVAADYGVLVELECAPAAAALAGFCAVIASFGNVNVTVSNHGAHTSVAVDERCAAEVVKRAILDEHSLFAAVVRCVSP